MAAAAAAVAVAVAMALAGSGVMCQSSLMDCANTIASLSPCSAFLNYTNNVTTSPSSGCCTAIAEAAGNAGGCLCQVLGTNYPLGFPINQTRLLVLPGACNANIPPLYQCTNAGAPFTPPPGPHPDSDSPSPSP
ncbi:hypothetical protein KI387_009810, partial [Taxus chinensis]